MGHRKRVRHYDEPGHLHELTFSCYGRLPLLTNDRWRAMLSICIDRAIARHHFGLAAFVYMPEHVHLLVWPKEPDARIHRLLKGIKQPLSHRVRTILDEQRSRLRERLTVQERPDKTVFRFWQEGGGYDRNLTGPESAQASIDYLHLNPVRRSLVTEASHWRWSSYRWFESEGRQSDEALPKLESLPSWFWDATRENAIG
ncbi:MAG: hypothetical protein DWQ31_18850 [Planctomycetota bacterium]|nr:MAG: hypothetical protein DWQ31_18850 [Planctomycetota bacterium]